MKKLIYILGLTILATWSIQAQKSADSTVQRRNTIKLDITSYWLYRNALNFTYERVTKPNQSFSITAGYQEFPRSSTLGSRIAVKEDNKKDGLKFGGEYRFYLAKENKYRAPHGVYIGPYFTLHQFRNERTIEVDNNGTPEEAILNTKFNIVNIGVQLGYQFVINNRWAIDLVFVGPSVSNYRFKATLDGNFTFDTEDIQNEIILDLIDRFPMLEEVINEKEASTTGKLDVWSYGYRYQLQVGYHFGRKK
jgi:Protein of unknown function (DUF3575)